jgi:hypothetical protein
MGEGASHPTPAGLRAYLGAYAVQGYALPLREASVLSLRDTSDFPAHVPDILGSGCLGVAGS